MKIPHAAKAHLHDAEEHLGTALSDLQCAWDCLSAKAQESELGESVSELMDEVERVSGELVALLQSEEKEPK